MVELKKVFNDAIIKKSEFSSALSARRNEIMYLLILMYKDILSLSKNSKDETIRLKAEEASEDMQGYLAWIDNKYKTLFFSDDKSVQKTQGKIRDEKEIQEDIFKLSDEINEFGDEVLFDPYEADKMLHMAFFVRVYYFLTRIKLLSEATDMTSEEFSKSFQKYVNLAGEVACYYEKNEDGKEAFFMQRKIPFSRFMFNIREEVIVTAKRDKSMNIRAYPDGKVINRDENITFSHHNRCKEPTIFPCFDEEKLKKAIYVFVNAKKSNAQVEAKLVRVFSLRKYKQS